MINCLTYIAFVYWAVVTVHTVLPIDVAVCGAAAVRGGLGALFQHAFGGELDVDVESWRGFPCNSNLLAKIAFIMARPVATVRHIINGGGQDQPFVPILFIVPLMFFAAAALRRLGLPIMSETAARTMLKFGVAVGCRSVILLQSLMFAEKESIYYKRYSKVEFFIIAWTAYIIELPVWHETLVSGGTAVCILLMCALFPHHMLPDVNPINVATQGVAAAALGVGHAYYLQRRRAAERAARAAAKAAAAAELEEQQVAQLKKRTRGSSTEVITEELEPSFASTSGGAGATMPAGVAAAAAATTVTTVTAAEPQETCGGTSSAAPSPPPALAVSAAAASSLATLRRIQQLAGRSYISPARPCRFSIKIQHAHLSDLPPNLMAVINAEALAASGWQAISAHAREGCVELVLDLRPLLPARPPYSREIRTVTDDRRGSPDQDRADRNAGGYGGDDGDDLAGGDVGSAAAAAMDPAALRDLARSIVSYLHRTGVLRHEREQMVMLQMGPETIAMVWNTDADEWVLADSLEAANDGSAAPPRAPPTLQYVAPRVALWPGAGSRLRLSAVLTGPSAEEILAGGGLVVRSASRPLPYSVLRVQPAATSAAAAAAEPCPLLVELAVYGVPSSGLIQVEARLSSGLLSAPVPVVVDHDAVLVTGLEALVVAMNDDSADALLQDFGTWLDFATARAQASAAVASSSAAVATTEPAGKEYDAPGGNRRGADSGKRGSGAAAALAATAAAVQVTRAGGLLNSMGGPAADAPYINMPYLDLAQEPRDQARGGTAAAGGATGDDDDVRNGASRTSLATSMLNVASDLLNVCCQGAGADAAVGAVVDRLIACVVACDEQRPPAAVLTALLNAVPMPPTNAGALHMAVAASSRPVVEVLVRWHERVYGTGGGCGAVDSAASNPWLARAACGVTPLHVAAAMPDGGAMAAWILDTYDSAAAVWNSAVAASNDGLRPAGLAAQLGGRWRLRLWRVSAAARAVRRAMTPPPAFARGWELLWGFRDLPLERRFSEEVSRQTVTALALYTAFNALLPLWTLGKAALYGSSEVAVAALAFHVPHVVPLVAWFCRSCPRSACNRAATTAAAAAAAAQQSHGSVAAAAPPQARARPRSPAAASRSGLAGGAGPGKGRLGGGGVRLQSALLAMHLCRAAAKAAIGLSLWPFALPRGTEVFVSRGGDIALEAVVRPLLEQVGLPARLLVSLADGPAMLLLYRGLDRRYPGLVPRPLERTLLYQVVLLATTAAVSAVNRARFLRGREARAAWVDKAAAAATSTSTAAAATATATARPSPISGGGGGGGRAPDPGVGGRAYGGSGGSGSGGAVTLSSVTPRRTARAASWGGRPGGAGSLAAWWTWLRGR